MIDELEKTNPFNTVLKVYWLPTLKAGIDLAKGNSAEALVSLEAAAPYEQGQPPQAQFGTLYPALPERVRVSGGAQRHRCGRAAVVEVLLDA
jgi:hypothetical protein